MRSTEQPFSVDLGWSRATVTSDAPQTMEILARIQSIHSLSIVERHPWSNSEEIVNTGEKLFRDTVTAKTFAVRARRSGSQRSRIEFSSNLVERELGTRLLDASSGVDLSNPQATVHIDISPGVADYYTDSQPGPGGLPLGVEGRGLALVSGGFDSAVAAWLMLRRGVALDYLFFNLGGQAHRLGVLKVMEVIASQWSYGSQPKLIEVDFRPTVVAIQERVTRRYWQVVLKRLMLQAAEKVADARKFPVLVTGEAVGQVSSQTIHNLRAIDHQLEVPVLRPLTTYNKDEIVTLSRKIGTFDLSSKVGEYCAILPDRPATRAAVPVVAEETGKIPSTVIDDALDKRKIYKLRQLDPSQLTSGLEIDHQPPGAIVIDLRTRREFDRWHLDGAVHLHFDQALEAFTTFASNQSYLCYCDLSLKSAHLAELMQNHGMDAHFIRMSTVRSLARSTAKAAVG